MRRAFEGTTEQIVAEVKDWLTTIEKKKQWEDQNDEYYQVIVEKL